MSSHTLDLSGQRQTQITLNDPATTRFWVPAKPDDDLRIIVGGVRELRIGINPETVRIERREFVRRSQRIEHGKIVRDGDGEYVYDEKIEERYVLVLPGSAHMFGRASALGGDDGATGLTPHSSITVKRNRDADLTESGTLLETYDLASLVVE
jgi:hypothetical protein